MTGATKRLVAFYSRTLIRTWRPYETQSGRMYLDHPLGNWDWQSARASWQITLGTPRTLATWRREGIPFWKINARLVRHSLDDASGARSKPNERIKRGKPHQTRDRHRSSQDSQINCLGRLRGFDEMRKLRNELLAGGHDNRGNEISCRSYFEELGDIAEPVLQTFVEYAFGKSYQTRHESLENKPRSSPL